jgi:diguanylate cyclase (GGDEF)-like protein
VTGGSLITSVAATTSHRDRDELDRAIARLLLQFLEAHSVTLFRLLDDASTKRLVCRVFAGQEHDEAVPAFEDSVEKAPALLDVPAYHECFLRNEVVQCAASHGRLMTLFPVRDQREVSGILAVVTAAALSSRDTDLVHGILEILKNHLALLDYGELDTLTGLNNRKTFEAHFDKLQKRLVGTPEPAAAAVAHEPSWLALIDIDRFKSINDGYGHLFGDEVLLLVSQIMKRNFRGADQLFRFGGEEFVVVLERATAAGARIALDRLRATIEAFQFPQVGGVTVSVGYTQIDPRDTPVTCIERADTSLYYAKGHGRNSVYNYEELIAAGELLTASEHSEAELF